MQVIGLLAVSHINLLYTYTAYSYFGSKGKLMLTCLHSWKALTRGRTEHFSNILANRSKVQLKNRQTVTVFNLSTVSHRQCCGRAHAIWVKPVVCEISGPDVTKIENYSYSASTALPGPLKWAVSLTTIATYHQMSYDHVTWKTVYRKDWKRNALDERKQWTWSRLTYCLCSSTLMTNRQTSTTNYG